VSLDSNPDVNALWPQHFVIELRDGRRWERRIETPIGHPDNPLSRERHLAKFRKCWAIGGMAPEVGEALIGQVDSLEQCPDVANLARMLARNWGALPGGLAWVASVGCRFSRAPTGVSP